MPAHHYVSKFHLREFCDPDSVRLRDPWLWVGDIHNGSVKRRAPKNVGTSPGLFDGPGGLPSSDAKLEEFLANNVEGPASKALRELRGHVNRELKELPPPLMRYLAWAASRALPLQHLEMEWAKSLSLDGPMAEPPPESWSDVRPRHRPVQLRHPTREGTLIAEGEELKDLVDAGWIPDTQEQLNFLESVHIQAYYFQVRWFPRLHWFTLRPPSGEYFIIGDRPIGWGVPDCLNAPPSCLRDPSAFLIAPLSHSLALVGRNDQKSWAISPAHVNEILAARSHDWIAGPTATVVEDALRNRRVDATGTS